MRWPGKVKEGTEFGSLIGLNDVYASIAEAVGFRLDRGEAEDSNSFITELIGKTNANRRQYLVVHSGDGMFALRSDRWKFIDGLGSGGFTGPARIKPDKGGPTGQLYDLTVDPGEQTNLWQEKPDIRDELAAILSSIKKAD